MGKTGIRAGLARMGLAAAPLEPHEFESAMHMLFAPAAPSMASVPNVVTPVSSTRCARDGCDRPRADPIHRLRDDELDGSAPDGTATPTP
jgi:hypothetical protein